jgi:hypothetical protein
MVISKLIDEFPTMEYLAAMREGWRNAERFLDGYFAPSQRSGDPEEEYRILYQYFRLYSMWANRYKHAHAKLDKTVLRLRDLTPPDSQLPLYVAKRLFEHFNNVDLALVFVRQAIETGFASKEPFYEHSYIVQALGLEIAILVRHFPDSEQIPRDCWLLSTACHHSRGVVNQYFVETVRSLIDSGRVPSSWIRTILQNAWGEYAQYQKFSDQDYSVKLAEIEELLASLPDSVVLPTSEN